MITDATVLGSEVLGSLRFVGFGFVSQFQLQIPANRNLGTLEPEPQNPSTQNLRTAAYLVGVAPLMTVSGSTSVETRACTMSSRSASAVGTWKRKFMPR